jgi:plasmid maintenance system antidote protein VapI
MDKMFVYPFLLEVTYNDQLLQANMTKEQLAQILFYKTERLTDFIENKRVMSLKIAISIADTIGCDVNSLYELIPAEH